MEARRQQRKIVAGIVMLLLFLVVASPMEVNASRHSDNSTGGSTPSTPTCPSPQIAKFGTCVNPPQPTAPLCPDGSVVPPNGVCVQLVPPQPPSPQPQTFLCPDGTTIDLSVTSQCPSPSPSPSLSGSSGSGSSSSKGSSSSISLSKTDIKLAILSCISANVTQAITTAATMNKTQTTNMTFLNHEGNFTAGCVPNLLSTTTTHHHKTSSSSKSILSTLMPSANSTKIPKPSTLAGTQDWRIGFEYGTNDGKVGVFDPSVCSPVNDKRITNEFDCGQGYKNGYVTACTATGNRFSCGDGLTTLK